MSNNQNKRKMDHLLENQIIDDLERKGFTEDEILDAIVDLEMENESFEGTYYLTGEEKKKARAEKKAARKAARAEKKQAKKDAKAQKKSDGGRWKSKGDGKGLETAERIGGLISNLGNTVVNVSGAISNLKQNDGTQKTGGNVPTPPIEEEDSTNWPLILGIGGAIIAVVVIIIILKKKK